MYVISGHTHLSALPCRVMAPFWGQLRVPGVGQRGGHLTPPGKREDFSEEVAEAGIHSSRRKALTPDPAAGQALWALWGHPALLSTPSLLSLNLGPLPACDVFLGPPPILGLFSGSSPQSLASGQPLPPAPRLSWPLPRAHCPLPLGLSHIWSSRPEASSAAHHRPI